MRCSVVIMAGGSGERFWPYSRREKPKQFLPVAGEGTLLQQAVRRARLLVSWSNIFIVTGRPYLGLMREQVPELPPGNLLVEPAGRDTAPCIALAASFLQTRDPGAAMVVLPSDHMVLDEKRFAAVIKDAVAAAQKTRGLVTIGIRPTRPETGYGYIHVGPISRVEKGSALRVRKFTEKPDLETAMAFLASGEYLWNSGMFVWEVGVIQDAIKRYLPELAAGMRPIAEAMWMGNFDAVLAEHFPRLPRISIDYGVMEKADNVWAVPGDFGWDDLGTWTALERVAGKDVDGNLVQGQAVLVDTRETIIRSDSDNKLVVTFGLKDTLVVDTPDVLLVADKKRAQDLKAVLNELRRQGLDRFLGKEWEKRGEDLCTSLAREHPVKEKPWGREIWWSVTEAYAGKILYIRAGHSLSKQYHRRKRETMLVIQGSGYLELGEKRIPVEARKVVDIPPGTVHRIEATTDMILIEISTPELDDVVRLEDVYGRVSGS
jgi:mannose-1-phosphate guanylyltransferase